LKNQAAFDAEVARLPADGVGAGSWTYYFGTDNRDFGDPGTHRLQMKASVNTSEIGGLAGKTRFKFNCDDSHRYGT